MMEGMMMKVRSYWTYGLSALALLACATPAMAQEADGAAPDTAASSSPDDEILVTASKTGEQALGKVPMAIQAFSGEQLQARQINEAADLINLIPGASQQSQVGAAFRIFSFRGSGAGGSVGDGMIGYYLDDTPFGVPNFQNAPPLRYFDVERVEVLRGPQGTLYGSGSMGGAIIFRTKNPDLNTVHVEGEAGISTTRGAGNPNYTASAALSVPLIADKLALRVSGGYDYRAGYADVYQGDPVGTPYKTDANDIRNRDLRAVLLWQPDEQLTVRLQAWYFRLNQDYLQVMNSLDPAYLAYQGDVKGYERAETYYYSGTVSYDFGKVLVTNATSFQNTKGGFGVALNLGEPLGIGQLINGYAAHNFINETRVTIQDSGPFHQVIGAFFQDASSPYNFTLDFPTLQLDGLTTTKTRNGSVFSEVSYDLFGGKLVPLVGLRYFVDDRTAISTSSAGDVTTNAKPNVLTWRANLAYYPSSAVTLFVNAGTGFRSGILQSQAQANAVIADGVPSAPALEPDKLRNLEAGVKFSLAGGALRVAASVYNIYYENLQSAFNTSIGLSAFANLGDAETTGVDLDLTWRTPLPGLSLSFVGNMNNAKFTNVVAAFAEANPLVRDGARMFNTPPHNFRVDANYTRDVGGGYELVGNAAVSHTGYARLAITDLSRVESYTLVDANIGVRKGPVEVSLYAQNLGDERGPTAANGTTLLAGPYPRTLGLKLRFQR
jgi:iron complex outermembrane recepter protein